MLTFISIILDTYKLELYLVLVRKYHFLWLKNDYFSTKVRTKIEGGGGLGHFVWVRIKGVCAAYVFYGRPHPACSFNEIDVGRNSTKVIVGA